VLGSCEAANQDLFHEMGHKNQIAAANSKQKSFRKETFSIASGYFTPVAYKQRNL